MLIGCHGSVALILVVDIARGGGVGGISSRAGVGYYLLVKSFTLASNAHSSSLPNHFCNFLFDFRCLRFLSCSSVHPHRFFAGTVTLETHAETF